MLWERFAHTQRAKTTNFENTVVFVRVESGFFRVTTNGTAAMERLFEMRQRLEAMRPLAEPQLERLWPMWRKEDALFVYASNAIEGNTLSLGETTVVLEHGVTIGGKTIKEHIEAINGARAYALMLEMARAKRPRRPTPS